jgi:hypothetical protein
MSASTPNVQRGLGAQQVGIALGAGALALAIAGAALLGRMPVSQPLAAPQPPAAVAPARDQGWTVDNGITTTAPVFDHGTAIDTATAPVFDHGTALDTPTATGSHGSGGSNGTQLAR